MVSECILYERFGSIISFSRLKWSFQLILTDPDTFIKKKKKKKKKKNTDKTGVDNEICHRGNFKSQLVNKETNGKSCLLLLISFTTIYILILLYQPTSISPWNLVYVVMIKNREGQIAKLK